ncbi:hypothetical protein [Streptomyces soliscabiei]|uniref:hypothetical protein n=1 Tax=Streptomyces soliscabiei TaxID=588897 RepID=UPI0029A745B7|nr:hypothetical protein [Streptomyces sp. NY05-11A]MDX2681119.1 hypothetical protein [Streptomyces sp. NY05-11A]
MPRWRLEYYLGTPYYPRDVEADFDDLLGEQIAQAHEYVRRVSDGAGTFRCAVLLVDQDIDADPVPGEPMITQWITYVPYRPGDDPDRGEEEPRRREAFQLPARLCETSIDAEGRASYASPPLGHLLLAIRRRLADGREGTILSVDSAPL